MLPLSELSRQGYLAPHHRCRGAARREGPEVTQCQRWSWELNPLSAASSPRFLKVVTTMTKALSHPLHPGPHLSP